MLVDAAKHPIPAMWQGLMLIGIAIWVPWFMSTASSMKSAKPPMIFLAFWTVLSSYLAWRAA